MAGFFSSGASKGTAAAHNIISNATRNTYYAPAPVYTPPQKSYGQEYYYEPEPVYTPPKATYTPPRNTYVAPKPVAPKPAPIKSTVQQIIDKAITAPKPAPAPVVDPMTTALKNQAATVTPWSGIGTGQPGVQPTLYRQAEQAGAKNLTPQQESQLFDLQMQMIHQAQQPYDGPLYADSVAQARLEDQYNRLKGSFQNPSAPPAALLDNTIGDPLTLGGTLSSISNTGGDILTGAWTGIKDELGFGSDAWYPSAQQAGQVYGDGTGGPSYVGAPPAAGGVRPAETRPEPYPYAPIDASEVWAPGQEFGEFPYTAPGGTVMGWDPRSQTPGMLYPEDVADWYDAMYGIDVNQGGGSPGAGFLGGFFLDQANRAIQDVLGSGGDGSGGGSYGGGGGGYGGGGGGGYGSGGGSGGGGGTGGGGGSVGGIPIGDVTASMDGWASRYLPASADEVLQNPSVIGYDTINDLGFDSDQLRAIFGDQADYVVNQLLPFLFADTPIGQTPSISSTINKVHDVLKNMATPGGSTIDVASLLELLFGQASQNKDSKNPTLMGGMFAGLTPSEQASAMASLVSNASNWAATPFFGQAIRNWYDAQQDSYLSGALSATPNGKSLGEILSGMVFPGATP